MVEGASCTAVREPIQGRLTAQERAKREQRRTQRSAWDANRMPVSYRRDATSPQWPLQDGARAATDQRSSGPILVSLASLRDRREIAGRSPRKWFHEGMEVLANTPLSVIQKPRTEAHHPRTLRDRPAGRRAFNATRVPQPPLGSRRALQLMRTRKPAPVRRAYAISYARRPTPRCALVCTGL